MNTLDQSRDPREIIDLFYYRLERRVKLFLAAKGISPGQLAADLDTSVPELDDLLRGAVNDEELGMVLIYLNNRFGFDIDCLWRGTAGPRATTGPVTGK